MNIQIFNDFMSNRIVIMAIDQTERGNRYYTVGDRGVLIAHEVERGLQCEPLISLDRHHDGKEFLAELANALAGMGIVADQTDTRRELSATQAHLKDMQRMANIAFDSAFKGKP